MEGSIKKKLCVFVPYWGSGNPYQDQLARELQREGVQVEMADHLGSLFKSLLIPRYLPDILHLHWLPMVGLRPMNFFRTLLFICRLLLLRVLGVKLVWTAHNLIPHESKHKQFDLVFTRVVGKTAHRVLAHCDSAREDLALRLRLNLNKISVVPHANYMGIYEDTVGREQARKELGIESYEMVMLFFGSIRPYKGVINLVRQFKLAGFSQNEVCLVIAGNPLNLEISDALRSQIDDATNIRYIPKFIDDKDVGIYMSAADVVVMPYLEILSSGAALLAMSFGKACIAPAIGCLGEVLSPKGSFLYSINDPTGLRRALIRAYENRSQLENMGAHNLEKARSWSWKRMAQLTLANYKALLSP